VEEMDRKAVIIREPIAIHDVIVITPATVISDVDGVIELGVCAGAGADEVVVRD